MRDLPAGLPSRADTPISCDRCGLVVSVGKTSWQQTSIQWPDGGRSVCAELGEAAEPATSLAPAATAGLADAVRGCATLRRVIDKAALANTLPVADRS